MLKRYDCVSKACTAIRQACQLGVSRRRRSSLHDHIMLPQFVISSAPLFYEITDFTKVDT